MDSAVHAALFLGFMLFVRFAWSTRPSVRAAESVARDNGLEGEDEGPIGPRVVWVSPERLAEIPWERRVCSPKAKAIAECGNVADTYRHYEPELLLGVLERRLAAWEAAPGKATEEGRLVLQTLRAFAGPDGGTRAAEAVAAVLEALSAAEPEEPQTVQG